MNGNIMEREEGIITDNTRNDDGELKHADNDTIITALSSPSLVTPVSSSENKQKDADAADIAPGCQHENQNSNKVSSNEEDGCSGATDEGRLSSAKQRRVRFSVCEYITVTETFVDDGCNGNGAHINSSFKNDDEDMDRRSSAEDTLSDSSSGSKVRYINGKQRRDSVHPLVSNGTDKSKKSSPWDVVSMEDEPDPRVPWSELTTKKKVLRVLIGLGKFLGLLTLLYFFVCSLDLLSLGFRLVGGSAAGEVFRRSTILQNPVVGVMIGVLTTVLVQSSSTSTSIIVGMVAAGFMDVRLAIPPIMGANIGTSITSTIVSFTQAGDREQFRRAFAGATVLDMFNWVTVIVLLPVEVMFGYLYYASKATVDLIIPDSQSAGEIQILSVITNPFVDLIVQLNDTVMECWATPNCTDADDASLIKEFCKTAKTQIVVNERVVDLNGNEIFSTKDVVVQEDLQRCDFLFAGTSMSDAAVGAIILVASLLVLCFCLVMIVKLLNSVLKGHVSTIIKHTLNADIPYVPWITGYLAILIGAVMTFLVQSSSVFTSALTPLVGLGVISLNRVYPLTLGANIGTTTTAILASMAAEGKSLHPSLQIALCHFFFNVTGVLLFYPIPFTRIPIKMAQVLGNTTAKYTWFAIFYLVSMFAVLPLIFISLSLAGSIYVVVLVSIIGVILLLVAIMTMLQRRVPKILPVVLRDWKWLPRPLRSLQPYDNLVSKLSCCARKSQDELDGSDDEDSSGGYRKPAVYKDSDFVFLSGNKIPKPPHDSLRDDDEIQQAPIRGITRIVPTRVIRNISNGSSSSGGGNGHANGNRVKMPLTSNEITPCVVPVQINTSVSSSSGDNDDRSKYNNKTSSNKRSISNASSSTCRTDNSQLSTDNSIPEPAPYNELESPSSNVITNRSGRNRNINNRFDDPSRSRSPPAFNLAYSDSVESVFV